MCKLTLTILYNTRYEELDVSVDRNALLYNIKV